MINKYYIILGVNPNASLKEIKSAYRDLVKVWHPDRFSHDPTLEAKAQEKLKEINQAYSFICREYGNKKYEKESSSKKTTPKSDVTNDSDEHWSKNTTPGVEKAKVKPLVKYFGYYLIISIVLSISVSLYGHFLPLTKKKRGNYDEGT